MKYIDNIKRILAGLGVLLVAYSCSDVLEEQPFSQISSDAFWQNNNDANAGIAAIYDAMQKTYDDKLLLWGEHRADNFDPTENSGFELDLIENNINNTEGAYLSWSNLYQMILRANIAIERIPQIPQYDRDLLAEAYAARAFAYFDVVRVWNRGPVFTEQVNNLADDLNRAPTEGDVIMQEIVIPDMLMAESLMTDPVSRHRFSQNSIWALQAEVYMYLGGTENLSKAKIVLDKIVDSGQYSLVQNREDWVDLFLSDPELGEIEDGPELIMTIKYDLEEDPDDRSEIIDLIRSGNPKVTFSTRLKQKWIEEFPIDSALWVAKYPSFPVPIVDITETDTLYGDWRLYETEEIDIEFTNIGPQIIKYAKNRVPGSIDYTNIPVYRYAGILLLLAEIENQQGNKDRAFQLVNEIRTARGLPTADPADYTTINEIEDFILDERQLELVGEGKRWWDLLRTGNAVEVMGPINGYTDGDRYFPFWADHCRDNPNLCN